MISVSSRYATTLCFALLPILGVVILHSYIGIESDDCSGTAPVTDGRLEKRSSSGPAQGIQAIFDAFEWREGSISMTESATRVRFAVVRSYDPKKLYHHPEVAFVRGAAPTGRGLEWVTVDGEKLPIHRAYYSTRDPSIFVAYLLVYQSQPVSNPYWTQLRSFPAQLFTGRHPMTLFFISGTGPQSNSEEIQKRAMEWLTRSWRNHKTACVSRIPG